MPSVPVIPILMYHKVGIVVKSKSDTFLNVSSADFHRQMGILKRLKFEGITLERAIQGLAGKASLPLKPVCITFDDGYQGVFDHAGPILNAAGWPGVVFIPTAYVGGANTWDEGTGYPIVPIMCWDRLADLKEKGWEMAGHTHSHPRLAEVSDPYAVSDILRGKAEIEERLNVEPKTFCYPFGSVGKRTPGMVKAAGFIGACTTASGLARAGSNPYLLPRVKVAYRDHLAGFLYRLLLRPMLP